MDKRSYGVVWISILLSVVVLVGGVWFCWYEETQSRQSVETELQAIAQLKMDQIVEWRAERFADADVLMNSVSLNEEIAPWIETCDPSLEKKIFRHFVMIDLYLDPDTSSPRISVASPVPTSPGASMILESDPWRYLYPMIQSWPVPRHTEETILVRRDGNRVLYLNELYYQQNTALKLSTPLTRAEVLSVMAVLGKKGMVIGKDYLGDESLAFLSAIKDTPWFMVAKLDTREAFAVSRMESTFIFLLVLLFLMVIFISAGFVLQKIKKEGVLQQAENEIRQLNAELEQRVQERTAQLTASNEELEAFTYSVSHDLRAPLRAVDGFSRMVVKDNAERLDEEGRRMLGVICSEAQRMGRLIDDLLAFSRLGRQQAEPAPVDMRELAQEVYAELIEQESPDRKLKLDLQPLPVVEGTRMMIRQVWVNLIGNAIKFTKGREVGEIEIAAQAGEDGVPVFRVKDNGAGVDMRYADKLFGVFQRLHSPNEFPGTGVGLALVQRIVRRHGGRIWAVGEVDHGATFYFTLAAGNARVVG